MIFFGFAPIQFKIEEVVRRGFLLKRMATKPNSDLKEHVVTETYFYHVAAQ